MEEEKNTKKKKSVAKKNTPEIISYGIKMVIPTVSYGNIQPEIIVKANSLEEAHDFIVPHINKLWKEYFLVEERKTEVQKKTEPKKKIEVKPEVKPEIVVENKIEEKKEEVQSPISTVAFIKASQAIDNCFSIDALDMISNQINISVKLTDEDKKILRPLVEQKRTELNG